MYITPRSNPQATIKDVYGIDDAQRDAGDMLQELAVEHPFRPLTWLAVRVSISTIAARRVGEDGRCINGMPNPCPGDSPKP